MPKTTSQIDRHDDLGLPTDSKSSSVSNNNCPLRDEDRTILKADLSVSKPVNDNSRFLVADQHLPGLLLDSTQMQAALDALGRGASGVLVPDVFEPWHVSCRDLYIGITTAKVTTEIFHWHAISWECFILVYGRFEMLLKWRWETAWQRRILQRPGSILVVQPQVCHKLTWLSNTGYAVVAKSPSVPGTGRPGFNGRTDCASCVHNGRTCVRPE
jgi:hypothetical protein